MAEKFHAMVAKAERNSRYKDFYDLHTLARHFPFEGQVLARAIQTTFDQRRTPFPPRPPVALTLEFYADTARVDRWQGYLNRNKLHGAPSHFAAVGDFSFRFSRSRGMRWHEDPYSWGVGRREAPGDVDENHPGTSAIAERNR